MTSVPMEAGYNAGEFIMAGAYTTYLVQSFAGTQAVAVALPIAFLVAGAMGLVLERLLIRRFYGRPLDTLLLTWGVSLILQQLAIDLFGAPNVQVSAPHWLRGGFQVADVSISYNRLFIMALAAAGVVGIWLYLTRLAAGRRMRAVMQNRQLAAVSGVATDRVDQLTFFIGSGFAGLAGVALTLFALAMVVLLPAAVAVLLGLLVFRQRVRGAYFAVLSQALAAAFVILLVGQQGLTGGTNGLTNIQFFFGLDLYDEADQRIVYLIAVGALAVSFLLAWQLKESRLGRLLVAIRDGEDRVRYLGYDPAVVKTVAYAFSAALAGIGGALFVPVVGIISPAELGIVPSLAMLIGVAIGGRYSLVGAVAGALLYNYAETSLSEAWPSGWKYLVGALFIAVMVWAPRGLAGLLASVRSSVRLRRSA
ncbi:ABC transporter permease subunit [Dactylosporangium darangshiense]|uniref:Branched-chain amino acid ABC transporter permease n=1 Tax=Dactylosporangium darangshiense TaxID=579108 RepID=A0ABP8D727_9ACTN